MNILFITLYDIRSIGQHDLYSDLMRKLVGDGHSVYVVSPIERRCGMNTQLIEDTECGNAHILKLKTGNIQKTNAIEKGISTILIEYQLQRGIKKHLRGVKFDMVLYSTPPITLIKPVRYIKKRDGAKSYLMLKDIFPQNAVDIDMMSTRGIGGLLHKYFRNKEKKLYTLSDTIGCMSPRNIEYLLEHNPEISADKVELCPNCIEAQDFRLDGVKAREMREKYGIPTDKKVFVYGGNLGRPQGIPFIIDCLRAQKDNDSVFFLIVGNGTEYSKLESFVAQEKPDNVKLLRGLPKDDYDRMIAACDVGMIFLDHRFTIPNFPSRLLSYMQAGLPVLACTDTSTDIGEVIVDGGFGWWCESRDVEAVSRIIVDIVSEGVGEKAERSFEYLCENYDVKNISQMIERRM